MIGKSGDGSGGTLHYRLHDWENCIIWGLVGMMVYTFIDRLRIGYVILYMDFFSTSDRLLTLIHIFLT